MLGTRRIGNVTLDLFCGDITEFACDGIANAANSDLSGGAGVNGAIHKVGGPTILQECSKIGQCPTGEAVITSAGDLSCKYVIHAVGPIWNGGANNEDTLLKKAYQSILRATSHLDLQHLAIPSISTGIYGYPIPQAAYIAIKAIKDELQTNTTLPLKRMTCGNIMPTA